MRTMGGRRKMERWPAGSAVGHGRRLGGMNVTAVAAGAALSFGRCGRRTGLDTVHRHRHSLLAPEKVEQDLDAGGGRERA